MHHNLPLSTKTKLKLFLLLLLLLGGGRVRPARAQMVLKLSAIPPRLEIEAQPGEALAKQIKVRNEGDSQVALEVKIQDFIVTDKEGTPLPVEEEVSGRWAASRWISVSPRRFYLNPGETKILDLVVIVPEEAAPGGHYAVVFYSPVTPLLEEEGTKGIVSPNVGTLVYVTVAGEIKENARVVRMKVPKFQEYGPVKIVTEIENLSDVHIQPLGVIRIYNWLGKLNTTLKLAERNIFPGNSRLYENEWTQKWGFGKYKAKLEAAYGTQGKALIATVFFWIIPWRVITIAVLTITLVVLLILYWKRPRQIPEGKK